MTTKKPPWCKPELVVLVRGRPEESVLAVCKTQNTLGAKGYGCLNKQGTGPCNKQNGS